MCIANGENASHGKGITLNSAETLNMCGVDVITLGNHWTRREMTTVFDDFKDMVRPANFPKSMPGEGSLVFDCGRARVGVINVQGRIYLDPLDSPFEAADKEIAKIKDEFCTCFCGCHKIPPKLWKILYKIYHTEKIQSRKNRQFKPPVLKFILKSRHKVFRS